MKVPFLLLCASLGLAAVPALAGSYRYFDDPKAILTKGPADFVCRRVRDPFSAAAPQPLKFRLALAGKTIPGGYLRTPVEISRIHMEWPQP